MTRAVERAVVVRTWLALQHNNKGLTRLRRSQFERARLVPIRLYLNARTAFERKVHTPVAARPERIFPIGEGQLRTVYQRTIRIHNEAAYLLRICRTHCD